MSGEREGRAALYANMAAPCSEEVTPSASFAEASPRIRVHARPRATPCVFFSALCCEPHGCVSAQEEKEPGEICRYCGERLPEKMGEDYVCLRDPATRGAAPQMEQQQELKWAKAGPVEPHPMRYIAPFMQPSYYYPPPHPHMYMQNAQMMGMGYHHPPLYYPGPYGMQPMMVRLAYPLYS
jgi:hypothetical protein